MQTRLTVITAGLLLAVGPFLVVAPLAIGLPGKAEASSEMLRDFEPNMSRGLVQETRRLSDQFASLGNDLVPVVTTDAAVRFEGHLATLKATYEDTQKLLSGLAAQSRVTPEQYRASLAQSAPGLARGLEVLPAMERDFAPLVEIMKKDGDLVGSLPTYLALYDDAVSKTERNVDNFDQAKSLPVKRAAWTFIVPGVVITLAAGLQLVLATFPRRRGDQKAPGRPGSI